MPLVLRRARPPGEWSDDDYDVMSGEYRVGRILRSVERAAATPWKWSITGEAVAGQVNAQGFTATLEEAKTELAANWRRFLQLNGLPEEHRPTFG